MSDDDDLSRNQEEEQELKDPYLTHSRVFDKAAFYRTEKSYKEIFSIKRVPREPLRPSNPEGIREKIVRLELLIRYYSNYIKKFKVPILNDLCNTLKVSTVTN